MEIVRQIHYELPTPLETLTSEAMQAPAQHQLTEMAETY